MTFSEIVSYYFLIGFTYWCLNMFYRDLPSKNEDEDGWWLSPLWFLGWPLCLLALFVGYINDEIEDKF